MMDGDYLRYIFDQEPLVEAEPCEHEELGCKITCCCGEHMDHHGYGSGHSPVSMHDYYCCAPSDQG
jgi:hypothetical protein